MKQFKILIIFLLAVVLFTSCDVKLPNASITGATPWDYVPYGMMVVGALFMAYCGIDQLKNSDAYSNKQKNPAVTRFVFGVGGAILLVMGIVIAFS